MVYAALRGASTSLAVAFVFIRKEITVSVYSKNRYLSFLHRLLFPWLKMKIVPRDFSTYQADSSVCYILRRRSFYDLLVLEQVCRKKKLLRPRLHPHHLAHTYGGGYLCLDGHEKPPRSQAVLRDMIAQQRRDRAREVRLIPVSVFWGRNPGRKESSFLRAFFSDAESLNPLRRFLIMMVQGRDILVNFGKSISLQEFVREEASPEQLSRKLSRVLRVHFRTQKNAALGPQLYRRSQVIEFLLSSHNVRSVIASEAQKRGTAVARVTKTARKNLESICSDLSPRVVLLFYLFLNWFFRKIFTAIEVRRSPALAEVARTSELIYLPCHRSHIDYLLLSYVLYREGLMVPHFGSGDNLDFLIIGTLFRKAGAFFLRRKFRGNRLYTVLFSEYMHYLVSKGYPLCFFPEGTRSRNGLLLEPKTGMLAMIAQSYERNDYRKIALVPVYIGYDCLMEAQSFGGELRGTTKVKHESLMEMFRARKVLSSSLGKAYVSFGEPLSLGKYLAAGKKRGQAFHSTISSLAHTMMEGIADHTVVTPVSLAAIILLAKPQKSIAVMEFSGLYRVLRALSEQLRWASHVQFPDLEPSALLHLVQDMPQIKWFKHESGDILYLDDHNDPVLLYAASNIAAVFLIPALIARLFRNFQRIAPRDLVATICNYYRLMRGEFFLKWDGEIERVVEETLAKMLEFKLLHGSSHLSPPALADDNFLLLHNLGCFTDKIFERYAVLVTLLAAYQEQARVPRQELERQYSLLLQRIAILKGRNVPYYRQERSVSYQIENFKKMMLLNEGEDGMMGISPRLKGMARGCAEALGRDIGQSIKKIAVSS